MKICLIIKILLFLVFLSSIKLLGASPSHNPALVYGTYIGGKISDYGANICADDSGNVYICGSTSLKGLATSGAWLTGFSGIGTSFLMKMNNKGRILWATYIGGDNYTEAFKVVLDKKGNIYLTGFTASKTGIATSGAYQTIMRSTEAASYGGNAFLSKFSNKGQLLWGTYFGGKVEEVAYDEAVDGNGNVFITGVSSSPSGIATSGAYNTVLTSAAAPFLAQFNPEGNLVWATYYAGGNGGWAINCAFGISIDKANNIYITGATNGLQGIASKGAYQESFSGTVNMIDENAFIVKFTNDGKRIWGTYFGSGHTHAYGIAQDKAANIYIVGYTDSDSGIITKKSFKDSFSGQQDGFIAKFDSSGHRIWGTYYGGKLNTSISGVTINNSGQIFISGESSSDSGIATPNAYIPKYTYSDSNKYNVFLAEFDTAGMRHWGTYFATNNILNSYWKTLACDTFNNIYLTGSTSLDSGIITKNALQPKYGGGTNDAFVAKFSSIQTDAGLYSILPYKSDICIDSIDLNIFLQNFGINDLDSVQVYSSVNGVIVKKQLWSGQLKMDSAVKFNPGTFILPTGTDMIKFWTSNPNGVHDSFPFNDTLKFIIHVFSPPKASFSYLPQNFILKNSPVSFENNSINANGYRWLFGNGDSGSLINPVYNYPDTGNFKILLIANEPYCPADTSIQYIQINSTALKIYIPNAFSPNGDGLNDSFDISGFAIKSYTLDIFNQWDEHVYHVSVIPSVPVLEHGELSSGKGWDGTVGGADAPIGTYIYQIGVVDLQNNIHMYHGKVQLIR